MSILKKFIFGLMFISAGTGFAHGQGFGISEFRAGVMLHSIDEPGPNGEVLNFSRLQDVSFDVLFTSPDIDVFRWIGSPRPRLGATVNFAGLESMVRLGLTWQVPLWDSAFFIEGTFGAAVHNGVLDGAVFPARNLGCLLQFYEAGGLGMNVSDNMTVVLEIEHASTAELCTPNKGLTNLGVKVGFKF
ncbi:MAG: acyloxyacyl hydrolase [Devosiaceae bacterium]|nr:acyloxyacyl hydrolase [Devosiaceae bacterium]